MQLMLMRGSENILLPADETANDAIALWPVGQGVSAEVKRVRSIGRHRRAMVLLRLAFDLWEPDQKTYKGQIVAKEFERFRKDITILAGYGNPVFAINGEIRMEAKSISFARMEEDDFIKVYSAILDVVWKKVCSKSYRSPEELDLVVNQLLNFS